MDTAGHEKGKEPSVGDVMHTCRHMLDVDSWLDVDGITLV